jgi:hypothetical protein
MTAFVRAFAVEGPTNVIVLGGKCGNVGVGPPRVRCSATRDRWIPRLVNMADGRGEAKRAPAAHERTAEPLRAAHEGACRPLLYRLRHTGSRRDAGGGGVTRVLPRHETHVGPTLLDPGGSTESNVAIIEPKLQTLQTVILEGTQAPMAPSP